jgi:hypothetical protein
MVSDIHGQVNKALEIVGPEDFSADGVQDRVEITGDFANAIIDSLNLVPDFSQRLRHYPIRLSRFGVLEIWINGWYSEGSGVRRIVHEAVRRLNRSVKSP